METVYDPQAFFQIGTRDPSISLPGLIRRLEPPTGPIDVVLDTDTFNEVDDQFALSYLLKQGDRLRVKALYAAPFHNEKSAGPADGMEKSYREILTLLPLLGREDLKPLVYKGSPRYLPSEGEPVPSPAAEHLARLAAGYTPERPLYVVAIGAITNVASALLLDPSIRDKVVIVWLGGHALTWPRNNEFNLAQDIAAARVVLGCGAAVALLPCMGVVSGFQISKADLETYLKGKNPLCDYLVDTVLRDMADSGGAHDNADRLGNAALFADHAAHIVFRHAQMVDDGAILSHGINRHPHRVLIFHKAAGNSNQQFLHLGFPPFGSALLTGSQPS